MNRAALILAMDLGERRLSLLRTAGAVAVVAVIDLALAFSPARLAVWIPWAGTYLLAALAIRRFGHAAARPGILLATLSSVASLLALASLGAGSASPYFLVLVSVPLLMALMVPDDLAGAGMAGLAALAGGAAVLVLEGRAWGDLLLWGAAISAVVALAVSGVALHRRRQERAVTAELERMKAVERLAESERARALAERWAAIGLLAEGVAHDVNSPLGSLRSNLAFAREELASGRTGELDEALADAQEGVERIREIVASLQAFSHSETEAAERRALAERPTSTPAPGRLTPAAGLPIPRRSR